MAVKKTKKDFDKERMYAMIMPTAAAADPPPEPEASPEAELPEAGPVYVLRNYMEDLVLDKLSGTMEALRVCTCDLCKKQVMAHTLNALPPSYLAVEEQGVEDALWSLRSERELDVTSALIRAVHHIKTHPCHR